MPLNSNSNRSPARGRPKKLRSGRKGTSRRPVGPRSSSSHSPGDSSRVTNRHGRSGTAARSRYPKSSARAIARKIVLLPESLAPTSTETADSFTRPGLSPVTAGGISIAVRRIAPYIRAHRGVGDGVAGAGSHRAVNDRTAAARATGTGHSCEPQPDQGPRDSGPCSAAATGQLDMGSTGLLDTRPWCRSTLACGRSSETHGLSRPLSRQQRLRRSQARGGGRRGLCTHHAPKPPRQARVSGLDEDPSSPHRVAPSPPPQWQHRRAPSAAPHRYRWTRALIVTLAAATTAQLLASRVNDDHGSPSCQPMVMRAPPAAALASPQPPRLRRVEPSVTSPSASLAGRDRARARHHRHARRAREGARPGHPTPRAGSPGRPPTPAVRSCRRRHGRSPRQPTPGRQGHVPPTNSASRTEERGCARVGPPSLDAPLRVSAGLTRWVFYATATAGLAASARFAIAPPRPPAAPPPAVERRDLAAEGFASQLARGYLAFDGDRPDAHRAQLASFVGDQLDPDLGLRAPPGRAQRVRWTQVVQSRRAPTARVSIRSPPRPIAPACSTSASMSRVAATRHCASTATRHSSERRSAHPRPPRRKGACATSPIAACAPRASARCATTSRARATTSTRI